jgi:8-oxo-dGTP diphosphatase
MSQIEKPIYASDTVVLSHEGVFPKDPIFNTDPQLIRDKWEVLLIKRKYNPFVDCWALPGGHVDHNETSRDAAYRELKEETSLDLSENEFHLINVFDKPGRDPRGWAVTCAYLTIVDPALKLKAKGGDDAKEACWFSLNQLPEMAFDHLTIIMAGMYKFSLS